MAEGVSVIVVILIAVACVLVGFAAGCVVHRTCSGKKQPASQGQESIKARSNELYVVSTSHGTSKHDSSEQASEAGTSSNTRRTLIKHRGPREASESRPRQQAQNSSTGWTARVPSGPMSAPATRVFEQMTTMSARTARSTVVEHGTVVSGEDVAQQRAHLRAQLASMAGQTVLDGELTILQGPQHIHEGGQAIVQIAEDSEHNAYAMKFFLSRHAFQHEKSLYLDHSQPMQQMLPRLTRVVEEGDMCDTQGQSMPPLIVMEKGESLDVWLKTSGSLDRVGCLQVLVHVSERLRDLHNAQYVHRDIKPSNLMFLLRRKVWTLIDFGGAVKTNSMANITFTLYYAAPEILQAVLDGDDVMHVTPALDAWALGIVALELFNGQPIFDTTGVQPIQEIISMILGTKKAPWEDRLTAPPLLNSLGSLKSVVLGLLQRDPQRRKTMSQCFVACNRILVQSTSAGATEDGIGGYTFDEDYVSHVAHNIAGKINRGDDGRAGP